MDRRMTIHKLATSPKSNTCKLPKQSSSEVQFGLLLSSIVLRIPQIASHASTSNMRDQMWVIFFYFLPLPVTPVNPVATAALRPMLMHAQ